MWIKSQVYNCISGLIRSFNIGASQATAPVLTFLTSSCEVNTGWLEPLINRVAHLPNTVAVPILDNIDAKTLQYQETQFSNTMKGGNIILTNIYNRHFNLNS